MKLWMTVIAGAALLVLGATTGVAQEERRGPPGSPHFFERLDADKDGKIALDEIPESAPEQLKEMLAKADEDGDKVLTKAELEKAMQEMRSGRGRPGPPAMRRPGGDSDADRGSPRGPGDHGRPGPPSDRFGSKDRPGPSGPPPFDRFRGRGGESFMSKIDKNEDGAIDKDEATAHMNELFDRADADKDGKIDREEGRRAMMAAMMKAHVRGRGPQFGRPPMHGGFKGPMMGHRGPWRAPQMGHGMRGKSGPQFGRPPMGQGPKGPMMGHRGPWQGPQMGRGMHGKSGPQFGRPPMHGGLKGPMMSDRGRDRHPDRDGDRRGPDGPRMGRGHGRPDGLGPDAKKPDGPKKPDHKKAEPEKKPKADKEQ